VALALLQSNAEVKERLQLYVSSLSVPSWHVIGCTLTFYMSTLFDLHFRRYAVLFVVDSWEISLVFCDGYMVTPLLPIGQGSMRPTEAG
jgi:hypothetical protein